MKIKWVIKPWGIRRFFAILLSPFFACSFGFGADASSVSLDQFMTNRGYVAVPLKRGAHNHLLATATLRGKTVQGIVDTGAVDLVIDSSKARGLPVLPGVEGPRYGLFGKVADKFPKVVLDRFEFYSHFVTNQVAVVYDLRQARRVPTGSLIPVSSSDQPMDLVLGMSFLQSVHAWIDCRALKLYFRSDRPGEQLTASVEESFVASGFERLPVVHPRSTNMLLVEGQVNGMPAGFFLDTGAIVTLFDRDLLGEFGLKAKAEVHGLVDASGRGARTWYTRVTSLAFGNFVLRDFPVATADLNLRPAIRGSEHDKDEPMLLGLLGPEILDRAAALIDCENCQVYLMKQTVQEQRPKH